MKDERKIELYNEMLGYLVELIDDGSELVHVLLNLGFTKDELRYELGDWFDDFDNVTEEY